MMIRLNKYLAGCGMGSRRECDRLIESGAISVNGQKLTQLGVKIDPASDSVSVRGQIVEKVLPLQYIAFNKPRGIMVTASDPEGRQTVYDVLEKAGLSARHLKYVGRLDYDSEGLLLMTNDGALVYALTHPKFGIKKTYRVLLNKPLEQGQLSRFVKEGVESEGVVLKAGRIVPVADECRAPHRWYEIDLFEGKNRQIRRMMEAVGCETLQLRRIQFGVVKMGDLKSGAYRELIPLEVMGLSRLGHSVSK
jgi:23S rRNA pseudouridine2605 synthase